MAGKTLNPNKMIPKVVEISTTLGLIHSSFNRWGSAYESILAMQWRSPRSVITRRRSTPRLYVRNIDCV